MSEQHNGKIAFVNPIKGFGFITPSVTGKPNIFFSFGQLQGNAARLPYKGESVIYEVGTSKRGPIALSVYNLEDPWACQDYAVSQAIRKSFEERKQAAIEGRKAFTEALIERNRQWHAARTPSSKDVLS